MLILRCGSRHRTERCVDPNELALDVPGGWVHAQDEVRDIPGGGQFPCIRKAADRTMSKVEIGSMDAAPPRNRPLLVLKLRAELPSV